MGSVFAFLESARVPLLALHVFGACLGVGGSTISDILFFRFLRDARISPKEASILRFLAKIILMSMTLLIITGVLIFLPRSAYYAASGPFVFKMFVTGIVSINGLLLHLLVAPRLLDMCFITPAKEGCVLHPTWRKAAFAFGAVSMTSWYTVFFTAMMKTILPQSFWHLLAVYAVLLLTALITSQLAEAYYQTSAAEHRS